MPIHSEMYVEVVEIDISLLEHISYLLDTYSLQTGWKIQNCN